MIDHAVSMAVAVQSHKGVYALLLGSGISCAAGIPTGWEIISDLIKRVAAAQKEDAGDDPIAWFRTKFDKEPSYSELLKMLAPTPAERTLLLRDYFEPNDTEREEGLKLPTDGHKAIARLVAAGNIRVIVTTNFDRLLERAIEAQGVSPTVVSTEDQVEGMIPLPHVQCLVLKVHGDYLDTRLRNTPDELAKYPEAMNDLLNRIFTDYGLIICGWSGDWDVALTDAITRNTRFRFSTYWLARGKLSTAASDLVTRRQAIVVPIEDADQSFTLLTSQVEAIEQERLIDPTSPRIAVARAKRLLSSDQYRIDFHDLVMRELKEVRRKTSLEVMPLGSPTCDKQSYPRRVEQMAAACSVLVPVVATGVRWGEGTHDEIWRRCITLLARSEFRSGSSNRAWSQLQYLPACFIAYSACAAALVTRRFDVFRLVFLEAQTVEAGYEPMSAIEKIGVGSVFMPDAAQSLHGSASKRQTPGSDWMIKKLESMLIDVLSPEVQFEELWDEMELIISLISADVTVGALLGRFMWRRANWTQSGNSLIQKVESELDQLGENARDHPLLAAGLFEGDAERLRAALGHVAKLAARISF